MKILVTGANGQLGREIYELSSMTSFEFHFVDIQELDLTKTEAILPYLEDLNPDIIINCAAFTHVDLAEDEPELANIINAEVPLIFANFCVNNNTRLFHISTDYVFDGNFNRPINENCLPRPLSVYGRTKLDGENKVLSTLSDAYIIRTSWLYSRFGNNFIKTMLKLGKEREEISVVFDQVGTPTHARDLAKAILDMIGQILSENNARGVYHFSNEGVCSWYDFAVEIFRQTNINCRVTPIPSELFPTKAKRPYYSVLDKSKIKSQFDLIIPHWTESLSNYFNE